jgi:nucleoside-diphosphate-sugar epimerase
MWSFVHVDDAALATVHALHHGRGIYNITDDDPAPAREWITELAARCHRRPMRTPPWLARLIAGPHDPSARRVQRESEARARVGAHLSHLARDARDLEQMLR